MSVDNLSPLSTLTVVAGVGLEPHDLRVMSPTSYQLLHPAIYLFSATILPLFYGFVKRKIRLDENARQKHIVTRGFILG